MIGSGSDVNGSVKEPNNVPLLRNWENHSQSQWCGRKPAIISRCSVLPPEIVMHEHDAFNVILWTSADICVAHDDLGWKNWTTCYNKQNIGNRTPLSDGRKKNILRYSVLSRIPSFVLGLPCHFSVVPATPTRLLFAAASLVFNWILRSPYQPAVSLMAQTVTATNEPASLRRQ